MDYQEKEVLRRENAHLKTLLQAKHETLEDCKVSYIDLCGCICSYVSPQSRLFESISSLNEKTRTNGLLTSKLAGFESQMEIFEKRSDTIRTYAMLTFLFLSV